MGELSYQSWINWQHFFSYQKIKFRTYCKKFLVLLCCAFTRLSVSRGYHSHKWQVPGNGPGFLVIIPSCMIVLSATAFKKSKVCVYLTASSVSL